MISYTLKDYDYIRDAIRDEGGSDRDNARVIESILKNAQNDIRDSSKNCGTGNVLIFPRDRCTLEEAKEVELVDIDEQDCKKDRMRQYIGLLYDGNRDFLLHIRSRFDDKDNSFFSYYILSRVIEKNSYVFINQLFPTDMGSRQQTDVLLAIVFVAQLSRAFKRGSYREYRSYQKNDPRFKGKIDVTRHIRLNPLFDGNVAYTHREYTEDNRINQLILTTCVTLEKRYPWFRDLIRSQKNAKDYMDQMSRIMAPASKSEVYALVRDCRRKISHPIYHDWDVVRQLAILILRHVGEYWGDGFRQDPIVGVLFDMNRAWEIYLEQILNKPLRKTGYTLQPQREVKYLFPITAEGATDEKNVKKIRPDFILQTDQKSLAILDAKNREEWGRLLENPNKWSDTESKNKYVSLRENIFQVLSYMLILRCPIGLIVCPWKSGSADGEDVKILLYRVRQNDEDQFGVLGINVLPEKSDSDQTYEEYVDKMKERESKFVDNVKELLLRQKGSVQI